MLLWAAPSRVERRLADLSRGSEQRGRTVPWARVVGAGAGLAVGWAVSLGPFGPLALPPLVYAGAVAPAMWRDRVAAARAIRVQRASRVVVERLAALVASGRPAERALVSVAAYPSGASEVDRCLAATTTSYALGASLFRSLASEARSSGCVDLASLADHLERSRDLARGSVIAILDARDRLRAAERTRAIGLASGVEGKLMLVLVLCYLPALMLSVVVPLFVGILSGIGG